MTRRIFAVTLSIFFLAGCASIPAKRAALAHHEKLYRRLPYETDGAYRIIGMFYATDRKVKEQEGGFSFTA